MPRTATGSHYTYFDCPNCGQGIAEPFATPSGPIGFVHGHGRNRCRLVVWPERNRAQVIPHDTSIEDAIDEVREHLSENGWTLTGPRIEQPVATAA